MSNISVKKSEIEITITLNETETIELTALLGACRSNATGPLLFAQLLGTIEDKAIYRTRCDEITSEIDDGHYPVITL